MNAPMNSGLARELSALLLNVNFDFSSELAHDLPLEPFDLVLPLSLLALVELTVKCFANTVFAVQQAGYHAVLGLRHFGGGSFLLVS